MRAVIVAAGDLGRSARMQYHARALAGHGAEVDLVGLEGTPLPRVLLDDPRITVHRIDAPARRPHEGQSAGGYALAAIRGAWQLSRRLRRTLKTLKAADLVLVQSPPAFPAVAVTWSVLKHKGTRFVIDWHNLGYTQWRLRLGRWHPLVRLARWVERRDARRADDNLSVSRGLSVFLESKFGAKSHVLYDRPAAAFAPIERVERERFRQALFTRLGIRAGVVGFIVCPTSWTEDEDFDLVIDAVTRLEDRIRGWEASAAGRRFADLVILVTGDGARRAEFERRFAGLPARRVQLRTRWLDPEDYPRVVGSADIGLCLHRSSSGLDIPMKVADLFGAGVPVLALDYGACLAERVRHGDNGLLFSTARQLGDVLFELFETFPTDQASLDRLRAGARRSARPTWEEGWDREARSVLLGS